MDFYHHQSATKRESHFDNQDELMSMALHDEGNSHSKRRKFETNPMKMGNIVEYVLSFLNIKSVKELRRVSKLWSSEGAKLLFKRCYVSISWDHQVLLIEKFLGKIKTEQEEFEAFLSHKFTDVPNIPNITIERRSDFALWKSLGVLGPQVHYLKLTCLEGEFEKIHELLNLLPNLKYLDLDEICNFYFQINKGRAVKALSAVMYKAGEDRCPLVISSMTLLPGNSDQLEDMDRLSDCNKVKIEKLHVDVDPDDFKGVPTFRARITNILGKLLSNNADNLKSLYLDGFDSFLSLIEFPRLNSLKKIEMCIEDSSISKFPPSFRFSENAPNLDEFIVSFDNDFRGLDEPFENAGIAATVKVLRLDYHDLAVGGAFEDLFRIFPNVEHFEAFNTGLIDEGVHSLWKVGKNLKKLGIYFNMDEEFNSPRDLDAFFTGFAPETVEKLKNQSKSDSSDLLNIDELRVNPSVLDLKELEVLTIRLDGTTVGMDNLLGVTAEYAFKLMPSHTEIVFFSMRKSALCVSDQVSKLPNVTIMKGKYA